MVLSLCDRWHKLPSEVLAEDARVLRLLRIAEAGGYGDQPDSGTDLM